MFVVANDGLISLIAEGPDALSPDELDDMQGQMPRNQSCVDYIDRMLRTGRPLPLPNLPYDFDLGPE